MNECMNERMNARKLYRVSNKRICIKTYDGKSYTFDTKKHLFNMQIKRDKYTLWPVLTADLGTSIKLDHAVMK